MYTPAWRAQRKSGHAQPHAAVAPSLPLPLPLPQLMPMKSLLMTQLTVLAPLTKMLLHLLLPHKTHCHHQS